MSRSPEQLAKRLNTVLLRHQLKTKFGNAELHCRREAFKLKTSGSIVCLCGIIVLGILSIAEPQGEIVLAQGFGQDATKETKEPKIPIPFPSFEDDQTALCLSSQRQAKQIASIVEAYSRRLGSCATGNPNFRADCTIDFRRVVASYSQYELAVTSVHSYCR